MADIAVLKSELTADLLTRGYSGMTDAAAATDLNTVYRTRNRSSMTGSEILNAIVKAEFVALAVADKQMVWDVIHLGDINPFGIEADLMTDAFGGGSATLTALAAARKDSISRADELGLGQVGAHHIATARI